MKVRLKHWVGILSKKRCCQQFQAATGGDGGKMKAEDLNKIIEEFGATRAALREVLQYDPSDLAGAAVLREKIKELAEKLKVKPEPPEIRQP